MKTDYDVIVVGSGPSGSIAAYHLAKNKIKVLVIEKSELPRYKTCGGGVVARVFQNLPFDISPVVEKWINKTQIFYSDNLYFSKSIDSPVIAMCMRDKFDYFLLNKAVEEGLEVFTNEEVKNFEFNDNDIKVITKNHSFDTKLVIASDGAAGICAKKGGWKDNTYIVPALEYEIYVDENELLYFNSARFDFDVVPAGYGWVFPKADHLSVGIASFKKNNNKKIKIFLENYLKKLSLKKIKKIDAHGFLIPLRYRDIFSQNKLLLTGDAAGFADPLTGEGITYALRSGELAAKAIINASLDPEKSMKNYNNYIKNFLLPELKAAQYLSKVFFGNALIQKFILKNYGDKFSQLMMDIIAGKKSYLTLLKNPYNYLKLLRLHKPAVSENDEKFSLNSLKS